VPLDFYCFIDVIGVAAHIGLVEETTAYLAKSVIFVILIE
jgi:hypothetical protein